MVRLMTPVSASSISSPVAGASQSPKEADLPGSSSGDPVAVKPPFDDDDDFYYLYKGGWGGPGAISQEGIDFLKENNPGLFDEVNEQTLDRLLNWGYGIQRLFDSDPVKFQPMARYIAQGHDGDLTVLIMKYGEYKGNFYTVENDFEGKEWVTVHSEEYKRMKDNKRFVSQLREFLFDQSMSNDAKVANLQGLFPAINHSEENVSIDQLRESMNLLSENTLKQAQQQAIDSGLAP